MPDSPGELMRIPEDAATQKADALVDVPFVVLDIEYADTSDGRTHVQKMLVRHMDQTLGLYWTPSSWVRRVLEDWFRRYPGRELYATFTKEPLPSGGFKWMLIQRPAQLTGDGVGTPMENSNDQIPFGANI